jgi:hypothetical protein
VEDVAKTDAGIAVYYQSIAIEALKIVGLGCGLRVFARTDVNFLRLR